MGLLEVSDGATIIPLRTTRHTLNTTTHHTPNDTNHQPQHTTHQSPHTPCTDFSQEMVMVQKGDGGFLYATTDLAAIYHRVYVEKAKKVVYVTGKVYGV